MSEQAKAEDKACVGFNSGICDNNADHPSLSVTAFIWCSICNITQNSSAGEKAGKKWGGGGLSATRVKGSETRWMSVDLTKPP